MADVGLWQRKNRWDTHRQLWAITKRGGPVEPTTPHPNTPIPHHHPHTPTRATGMQEMDEVALTVRCDGTDCGQYAATYGGSFPCASTSASSFVAMPQDVFNGEYFMQVRDAQPPSSFILPPALPPSFTQATLCLPPFTFMLAGPSATPILALLLAE